MAVGQPEHVIEKSVLLVPHPGIGTRVRERSGNPEEMLDELETHLDVRGPVPGELRRDFDHVLAEERHPGRAVRLFEEAAGGKRRAAIEDADVVETEEPALERVVALSILPVHPPREVEQQLVEDPLEPFNITLPAL